MSETTLTNGQVLDNATIAPGTTDVVANDTGIYVVGILDNLGTLYDASNGYGTEFSFGTNAGTDGGTLEGSGVVLLSDNAANLVVATASGDMLVNVDNLIEGSGQLGANSGLAILNEAGAIIAATGTGAALTIQTGGGQLLTNEGLLESVGVAGALVPGLRIQSTTVNNAGGTILATGTASVVTLNNATVSGGDLTSTDGGIIYAENGTVFDGTVAVPTIASGSVVEVPNDNGITIVGTLDNLGTLFDDGGGVRHHRGVRQRDRRQHRHAGRQRNSATVG